MTSEILFTVVTQSLETRAADADDDMSRDSRWGVTNVTRATIVRQPQHNSLTCQADLTSGDAVYLVWATYTTREMFSTIGGLYALCCACASEAEASAKRYYYQSVSDLDLFHISRFVLQ